MSAYAGYAQSRERHLTDRIANEALLSEALGTTADDPSTAYSPARDGYFNPYGDGSANSAAVLAAIGSGYLDARNRLCDQRQHSGRRTAIRSSRRGGPDRIRRERPARSVRQ
jgi:hypothetical protein